MRVALGNERIDQLGDSHDPNDPAFAKFKEEVLRKHGVPRVEDLPFNYKGMAMAKGVARAAEEMVTSASTSSNLLATNLLAGLDALGWEVSQGNTAITVVALPIRRLFVSARATSLGSVIASSPGNVRSMHGRSSAAMSRESLPL